MLLYYIACKLFFYSRTQAQTHKITQITGFIAIQCDLQLW